MGQAGRRDKLLRTFRHAARITLAAVGDFDRDQRPAVMQAARSIAADVVRQAMRQIARPAENVVSLFGRADAAYQAEFAKWEALIADVRADRGLSDDQRASAIVALRIRQRVEAQATRRRIILEEKQAAKVRKAHAHLICR